MDLFGAKAGPYLDPLLVSFDDLDVVRGHLLEALQTTQMDLANSGRAQRRARDVEPGLPDDGAGHIERDVATADDDDALTQRGRTIQAYFTQQVAPPVHPNPIVPGARPRT